MSYLIDKDDVIANSLVNPEDEEFLPISQAILIKRLENIENEANEVLQAKEAEINQLQQEISGLKISFGTKLSALNDWLIKAGNKETHREKDSALFKVLQLLIDFRSENTSFYEESEF